MKQNSVETLMGAIVIGIAVLFVFFSYKFGDNASIDQKTFKARFDRIDGLVMGADVKISGVKVGTIKKMIVDPKSYLAEVTIVIDSQINLPIDTSAEIISESLLGGKYVSLVPGGDDQFLKEGDVISLTQSSINIESLIGQMIFNNKNDDSEGSKSAQAGKL